MTRNAPVALMRYERSIVVATEIEPGDSELDDTESIDGEFVTADRVLEIAQSSPSTEWTLTSLYMPVSKITSIDTSGTVHPPASFR